jgi:hypothetical protein
VSLRGYLRPELFPYPVLLNAPVELTSLSLVRRELSLVILRIAMIKTLSVDCQTIARLSYWIDLSGVFAVGDSHRLKLFTLYLQVSSRQRFLIGVDLFSSLFQVHRAGFINSFRFRYNKSFGLRIKINAGQALVAV